MKYLERLGQYLIYLGAPGLFLIALLDSAAVPMVGGPDAVVVLLSWRNPALAPVTVLAGTAGSVLGCLILHRLGRAGGSLALARVDPRKRERAMQMIERNASWAAFMSVAMPPPFPTKAVILAAGAFRSPLPSFTVAILSGRLLRYSALAWLGARFGDQAAALIKTHYLAILCVLLGSILLGLWVGRLRKQ